MPIRGAPRPSPAAAALWACVASAVALLVAVLVRLPWRGDLGIHAATVERLRHDRRDPLGLFFALGATAYVLGGLTGHYAWGRVLPAAIIPAQVAVAVEVATAEARRPLRRALGLASRAAHARLTTAASLAQHAEHPEIHAWTYETRAWRALTDGDYPRAVDLSRAAQHIAPRGGSAELQATAQEGRARARLGQRREAYEAVGRVQRLATAMVLRARPEHHYQYDPAKATSYTATTLAWLGDPAAEEPAREVIARLRLGGDATAWPRRAVSAHVDLALALLSCDRLDEACDAVRRAIVSGRLLPANRWRALEIVEAVEKRGLPEALELREAYEELTTASGG